MQAKILFWHNERKFGFAELESTGEQVFVGHLSLFGEVKLPLKVGTQIKITSLRKPRCDGDFKKAFGVTVEGGPLYGNAH
jgi:hypothetical protein